MGGIEAVIQAMRGHGGSAGVHEHGCGALRSLAVNAENKVTIAGMGGVEEVVKAMRGHPESEDLQLAGNLALKCLK
eukprot:1757192-Rhodomonas_salina.2